MPILAPKELCTGCTACVSICPKRCIEIKKDSNGFAYPEITNESACIKCYVCKRTCPVLQQKCINGDSPLAYAAFSNDESLRMASSSGGIFSEIAKIIIAKGGVVFGAKYNDVFEVEHCCIEREEDLYKLHGAKYSESNLGSTFIDILKRLEQGQSVLFSGTPCQVAGLKAYIKKDYSNLFCIDFVCHSVPSPMVWTSYIKYRSKKDANGDIPNIINMRCKETGWSNYQYSNVFQYDNNLKCLVPNSQSLFMKLFVGNYISRLSCENCKFKGYNRVSDITLGDFWGIWDVEPEMDDNKGTSVVLLQSEKGQFLWKEIRCKVRHKEVTLEQASQQNPSMIHVSQLNIKRNDVLERIRNGKIEDCESLFVGERMSIIDRIKGKVGSFVHRTLKSQ